MKIAVLGAGAWGTALAITLSARHRIALWIRDASRAAEVGTSRVNQRYLPQVSLPPTVEITPHAGAALGGADLVLIATPTGALRESLQRIRRVDRRIPVLWACKGFEHASALLPHQIVAEEMGGDAVCAVLSGPSFALEVAQGRPTALTVASREEPFARETAAALHQQTFRTYYSTDLVGVEVGAAVKNVMAIATGISDGLGLGMNARAALITRGLAEMTRLGIRLGGRAETFMGLTGAGDLILTCTGDLSRNRRVGLMLAQGHRLEEVLPHIGHIAEGVYSAQEVRRVARDQSVEMPITEAVCDVLFHGVAARDAVQQLLARDPREES